MSRVLDAIRAAIAERAAVGFVHVGSHRSPGSRLLAADIDDRSSGSTPVTRARREPRAYGVTSDTTLVDRSDVDHAAARLADRLAEQVDAGTLLVPSSIPHDAALFLESVGFDLASSDALATARIRKSAAERDAIRSARATAAAGVRRAASIVAEAVDGEPVSDSGSTLETVRREIDAAIVAAGGVPGTRTGIATPDGAAGHASDSASIAAGSDADADATVLDDRIEAGEPIVVDLTPGRAGFHARLVRTLVPGTDGGWERRAHVAVESALRSARVLLGTDGPTVGEVEAELVAEIGSFGFAGTATGTTAGIGLEPVERPLRSATEIRSGSVLTLEAGVERDDGAAVRLAEPVVVAEDGARWLDEPNWSLDPSSYTA